MQYSPSLDGIRAIAIGAVFVFHVFPAYLQGGFTGVDVFFVLSGFLITSIILQDLRRETFSLKEFYLRRIQRLMPNIVATVLAVLVLASLLLLPSAARQVGRHSIWTLANLSNIYIWRNLGGYWGEAAEAAPLLHTWSLAVEEQFYLLFPTSLVLLARFQRRHIAWWLSAVTALSFGLCLYATPRDGSFAFYLLPTRLWELALGAVMASCRTPLDHKPVRSFPANMLAREASGCIGLALICAGFLFIDEARGFPGAIALVPTVGTALVIWSSMENTRVSRILSGRFLVYVGKLSYSLYLWHWPLITIGKSWAKLSGRPPIVGAVSGAALSVACAWVAYTWIEQPLRARGPGRAWRLAVCASGFLIVGAASAWVGTAPKLDTSRYFDTSEFHGLLYSAGRVSDSSRAIRYQDVRFPPLDGHDENAWRTGGIIHQFGSGFPRIVVLGSSHALMYSRLIDDIARKQGIPVAFLSLQGTPAFLAGTVNQSLPTAREAQEFDEARRYWLRTWRPKVVFVIDRWDLRFSPEKPFDRELRAFFREVSPLAERVIFVAQPPVADVGGDMVNLRELMTKRRGSGNNFPPVMPDEKQQEREQAVAAAYEAQKEFPNVQVLRPDLLFSNRDGSIRWMSDRTSYYADDDHLTDAGAELARDLFMNAIAGSF